MTKEPFQSWEEEQAFESKVEPARKWIIDTACSLGFEHSAVKVERTGVTLRLSVEDHAGGAECEEVFDRRQIEGIADGDLSIRDAVYLRVKLLLCGPA